MALEATELKDEFDEIAAVGQGDAPPPETPQPSPVINPLFEEAKAAGLELGEDIADSDGLARFLLSQYTQQRPYAEFGRSALSGTPAHPQQNQQVADDQDRGAEETDSAFDEHKYFSEAWNVPELSPGAQWALKVGAVTTGDNGLIVAAEGPGGQAALPYLQELNNYQQARAQLNEKFAENPVRFLAEKLLPYFENKFSSKFQELSQGSVRELEQQNFVNRFRSENASWLYNAAGTQFTEHGQRFADLVSELQSQGLADLATATQYALRIMPPPTKEGGDPNGQQATPAPAAPNNGRQRDEHGRYLPAGTPAPAPKSFIDKAKQRAMTGHSQLGTEATVVANEGDLDSMWDNAWRAHSTAN